MAIINIEINCEIEIPEIIGTYDSKKKSVTPEDFEKFISGELGDHYLNILIPKEGIYYQLQAKKAEMKKKGAIFNITVVDGSIRLTTQGVFKVSAYSHVIPVIKNNPENIYVTGLFCGDWPPFGGTFKGVDEENKQFPVLGKLV